MPCQPLNAASLLQAEPGAHSFKDGQSRGQLNLLLSKKHALPDLATDCADFDAQALLDEQGKGKPLPAIVDQVISGSMLRVTLLPDRQALPLPS